MKNKIKIYRAIHELTQDQLSKKVGVARQTIHFVESGKYNPSTRLALKLARVLETTVDELFKLEEKDWEKNAK